MATTNDFFLTLRLCNIQNAQIVLLVINVRFINLAGCEEKLHRNSA